MLRACNILLTIPHTPLKIVPNFKEQHRQQELSGGAIFLGYTYQCLKEKKRYFNTCKIK